MKKGTSSLFWKASGGILGLIAVLGILIAVNVILRSVRVRIDLTDEKLYTLSDGTVNILGNLDRDVTLKFFFNGSSRETPIYLKSYADQVEDLLQEYKISGNGRLILEKHNPEPDSDAEEWAQRYGISQQQSGTFGGYPIYFGLVAVSGDDESVIPVLDPRTQTLLEYDITRLIWRVIHPEKPTIGVLSSLPVMGTAQPQFAFSPQQNSAPPWLVFQDIAEDFSLREIKPSADRIDNDIAALIVVHPKNLPKKTLYAIDQFLLRGGHLLVHLDPLNLADAQTSGQQPFDKPMASSNLEELLSAWGVGYDPDKVVADMDAISRFRTPDNRIEEAPPVWLTLTPDYLNSSDILTSQLEMLVLPCCGALVDNTSEDITFTPLITSSDNAGLTSSMMAKFGTDAIRSSFKKEPMRLNIAARLTGKFKTAFPAGRPPRDDDDKAAEKSPAPDQPHLKEGEGVVVLVADADMIFDPFCVEEIQFFGVKTHRPLNDNIRFFGNAAENITGNADLIGIRSRGKFNRPFDLVIELEQKARREWQTREDVLTEKLKETQQKLDQLQAQKDQSQAFILSPKQKATIEEFREQEMSIRKDLKDVRKNLRKEIEQLGVKVKVANIILMPAVVSLAGISFGIYRSRRKRG